MTDSGSGGMEKALRWDGSALTWMVNRRKFGAVVARQGYSFVLKRAESNPMAVQEQGAEQEQAWLEAAEEGRPRQLLNAQQWVYATLVLAIADALPGLVNRVDENDAECGTSLWNELLRKYQPTERVARARMVMQLAQRCQGFNGKNASWPEFIGGIESGLALLQSHDENVNAEEIIAALTLGGMMRAGGHWAVLATILVNEEPAAGGGQGITVNAISERAREHVLHQPESDTSPVVGYGAAGEDDPGPLVATYNERLAALEASALAAMAVKKTCIICGRSGHLASEHRGPVPAKPGGGAAKKEFTGECWDCGKKGHRRGASECAKKGGGGDGGSSAGTSVNGSAYSCVRMQPALHTTQEPPTPTPPKSILKHAQARVQFSNTLASTRTYAIPPSATLRRKCGGKRHVPCGRVGNEDASPREGPVPDTGCGKHMFQVSSGAVQNATPTSTRIRVAKTGPGGVLSDITEGDLHLEVPCTDGSVHVLTGRALQSGELGEDLCSIGQLTECGYEAHYMQRGGQDVSHLVTNDGRVVPLLKNGATWRIPTRGQAHLVRAWRDALGPPAGGATCALDGIQAKEVRNTNRPDRGINTMLHAFAAGDEENEGTKLLRLWHEKCGHLNFDDLVRLSKITPGMPDLSKCARYKCHCCMKSKAARKTHPKSTTRRSREPLGRLHIDFSGPFRKPSLGGARYMLVAVDDMSRTVWVFLTKNRSGEAVSECLKQLFAQEGKPKSVTAVIRSDNAREFCEGEVPVMLKEMGIGQEFSAPLEPEQNGVAERMMRTLKEMSRCLLMMSGLSGRFWGYAVQMAALIRNNAPTCANPNHSPPNLLYKGEGGVEVTDLHPFGCYAVLTKEKGVESDGLTAPKNLEGVFLGFARRSKAKLIFIPEKMAVYVSSSIYTDESEFPIAEEIERERRRVLGGSDYNEPGGGAHDIWNEGVARSKEESEDLRERRAVRMREVIERSEDYDLMFDGEEYDEPGEGSDASTVSDERTESEVDDDLLEEIRDARLPTHFSPSQTRGGIMYLDPDLNQNYVDGFGTVEIPGIPGGIGTSDQVETPSSYAHSKTLPQAPYWEGATSKEMNGVKEFKTYKVVDLPEGRKAIPSKLIYTVKRDAYGRVSRYKCRLVVQGFHQRKGVDFTEKYAPVAASTCIRLAVALATLKDLKMGCIDICQAFLHADLKKDEVVYVQPPKGYEEEDGKVWLLSKALYGLIQAPLRYFEKFSAVVKDFGMVPVGFEGCMYVARKNGKTLWLVTYVDDCLLLYDDEEFATEFKDFVGKEFKYTDEGALAWHLGVKYEKDVGHGTTTLTQSNYIEELLRDYGMERCNPAPTAFPSGFIPTNKDCPKERNEERGEKYRRLVGSLQWLQTMTRPDLGYYVSVLSRFLANPGQTHMDAAMHVLRYLQGTKLLGLRYTQDGGGLIGFVDADWAACKDTRKSFGGYLFKLAGAAICWKSKRQNVVALSTAEAEYRRLFTLGEYSWT